MKNYKKATNYLFKKGYDISFTGFEYLTNILINYDNVRQNKITDIYKEIAKKYNVKSDRVERNIRYLLNKKDEKCNKKVIANLIYDFNKKEE